jgi:hypothetical protein
MNDFDLRLPQARLVVIGFEEGARATSGIHLSVKPKSHNAGRAFCQE